MQDCASNGSSILESVSSNEVQQMAVIPILLENKGAYSLLLFVRSFNARYGDPSPQ